MKKKYYALAILCSVTCLLFCGCNVKDSGSLKLLSRPYIAQYECYEAKLGEENLLDNLDYVKVILKTKDEMQLIYKRKNDKKQIHVGKYSFDTNTKELSAEIWLLGINFKQSAVVEHGRFTVTHTLGAKQLVMKFIAV